MRFQRRGGRKCIVAPDRSTIVLMTTKPQPNCTLVKVLTRARRWQKLLDAGVSRSHVLPDRCVEQLLCRECSA